MKSYFSFLKLRFLNVIQYRAAAISGILTQFAWGFMYIMLYEAFYNSNISKAPMDFTELSQYIWLQQAFLALFMTWFLDNDIFNLISRGDVAYELCRPLDLYNMWFFKDLATRSGKALLRFPLILIVASFLPYPYGFTAPNSLEAFILFIISMILGFLVVIAYSLIVYSSTFFTISPMGVRMALVMLADFFAGGMIPLPFLPDWFTKYIYLSPFAAMQNVPFRIYSGNLGGSEGIIAILLQIFWLLVLVVLGRGIMKKALKNVVVQGG